MGQHENIFLSDLWVHGEELGLTEVVCYISMYMIWSKSAVMMFVFW